MGNYSFLSSQILLGNLYITPWCNSCLRSNGDYGNEESSIKFVLKDDIILNFIDANKLKEKIGVHFDN